MKKLTTATIVAATLALTSTSALADGTKKPPPYMKTATPVQMSTPTTFESILNFFGSTFRF